MKLASLKSPQRDGLLVVVDRSLSYARPVPHIARTLQEALDHWSAVEAPLKAVYEQLCSGNVVDARPFVPTLAAAPLPRAYHWVDGSAYVNHVELVRQARGAEMPASFWTDPLVYQGGSDDMLGACDPIAAVSEAQGIDIEGEVAIVTDDVPLGTDALGAASHVKLLMLVNDVSLRNLIPNELAKGFGFYHGKPSTAFSPVAITPDELGPAWRDGKVHLRLSVHINDTLFGEPECGVDMTLSLHYSPGGLDRALVADSPGPCALSIEDAVPGWHHGRGVRAARLYRPLGRLGANAPGAPHALPRGVCTESPTAGAGHPVASRST